MKVSDMTKNDYFKINGKECVKLGSGRISDQYGIMYTIFDVENQRIFEEQGNTEVHYLGRFNKLKII